MTLFLSIVTGLCNDRYSETRAVKSALLQQTVLYCSSMDAFVFLILVTLKQSFRDFCLHLLNLHQCGQTNQFKSFKIAYKSFLLSILLPIMILNSF